MALTNNAERVSVTPLYVDNAHKSSPKFQSWFTKHLPVAEAFNQYKIWNEWNNLLWYTGEILEFMDGVRGKTDFRGFKDNQRRTVPFWVNHLSDLSDKRSNDLASLKPNFEISPPSDNISEQTRMTSRVVRPILSNIRNFNNLDLMFDENERGNVLYGSSFLGIDWNDKLGDRRPPVTDKRKKDYDEDVKWEGEVEVKQLYPWHLLPMPALKAFDSPMCIQILDICHVEDARIRYGNKNIQPDGRTNLYGFASPFEGDILPEQAVIYRTIYRPDEFLPDGAVVYSTHDGTVVKKFVDKYPWSHNGFPWEMHSDINAFGRVFPYSILNNLKALQWTYNLLGGMIKKSIFLTAHPKWMMVRGAANIQSLANGITVVQHKAGQQPQLVRGDVVGADTTNFRGDIKAEMQKLAGSFGLSNGDIPPNTRSGIQISRLQNIEKMNRSYQMGKRNDFMRRVLLKSASVAGDRYPTTSAEHLTRILGRELADNIGVLKGAKLSTETSLKIQNGSGFSDDLAGRLEEVAFAREKLPGLMTPVQEADIIGVRSASKFYDVATAALRMAESENEKMNDGEKVPAPLFEQDHLQHWTTHVTDMQTPQHASLPEKLRKEKEDHLGMHEMMMEQIGNSITGQVYKQRLQLLERWPLVHAVNADLPAIQQEQADQKAQEQQAAQQEAGMQQNQAEKQHEMDMQAGQQQHEQTQSLVQGLTKGGQGQ